MKTLLMLVSIFHLQNGQNLLKKDSSDKLIANARIMANQHNKKYNPKQSVQAFTDLAAKGSGEAMNDLGVLYNKGIGVPADPQTALSWYKKAAKAGYNRAFYNMGFLYKVGEGTDVDMVKAYQSFKSGADKNDARCLYGQGYMLYKGLGCEQNYEQAVALFKKGAMQKDISCYYMLGLCFRNGYGLAINKDSATFYLQKAALKKDGLAIHELAAAEPENRDIREVPGFQASASADFQPVNLKSGYKEITHHLSKNDINGEYTGSMIKFDWSGKHIISEAGLKVKFSGKEDALRAEWNEEGQIPVTFTASIRDTAIIFNQDVFGQLDHYYIKKPLQVTITNAHYNLVHRKDTVYISGTPHLYSPATNEPQKPEFFMLVRNTNQSAELTGNKRREEPIDTLHFTAYPNPSSGNLQLRYTLKSAVNVQIFVSEMMTGAVVYRTDIESQSTGDHTSRISFNGRPGNYIVSLKYGSKIKSAIIIKQ